MEQNVVDHTDGVESLTTERSFVARPASLHLGGVPMGVHAIIQKDKNDQMFQVKPAKSLPLYDDTLLSCNLSNSV